MTQRQIALQLIEYRIKLDIDVEGRLREKLAETLRKLADLGFKEDIRAQFFRFSNFRPKTREEVKRIIADLRTFIYMNVYTHADAGAKEIKKNYDKAAPFDTKAQLEKKMGEYTLRERAATYANRFMYEAETWIAAALLTGKSEKQMEDAFMAYRDKPYANPLFNEARKKDCSQTRLVTGGVSYGIGQYVSAEASLVRLSRYALDNAFRAAAIAAWTTLNPIGYIVGRGSSYPCDYCDDFKGYQPAATAELPPYHSRCRCWAYPVIASELSFEP